MEVAQTQYPSRQRFAIWYCAGLTVLCSIYLSYRATAIWDIHQVAFPAAAFTLAFLSPLLAFRKAVEVAPWIKMLLSTVFVLAITLFTIDRIDQLVKLKAYHASITSVLQCAELVLPNFSAFEAAADWCKVDENREKVLKHSYEPL